MQRRRRCEGCRWAAAGPGRGAGGRRQSLAGHLLTCRGPAAPQAPPVWRAAEGPEGQTAAPMGGDGAWQNYSQRPSPTGAKGTGGIGGPGCGARGRRRGLAGLRDDAPSRRLAARTARGRAAAHGHNQQPGPTAHHAAPGTPAAPQAATQRKHAAAREGRRAFTQLVHTLDTVERPSIQCSRAATTSATWTALRAAPLRRLSPETTRMRPRLPSTA